MAKFSDTDFYEREIARKIGISYGSANWVLNDLHSAGLLVRKQRGKMLFYRINSSDPTYHQFKILNTIVLLRPIILELKKISTQIILYGSCARGEDESKSDIDLYIVSENKRSARRKILDADLGKGFEDIQIQAVIISAVEALESEKTDAEFLSLVREGIVLWEDPIVRSIQAQDEIRKEAGDLNLIPELRKWRDKRK
jgi:predicted nucleotidyltransferase